MKRLWLAFLMIVSVLVIPAIKVNADDPPVPEGCDYAYTDTSVNPNLNWYYCSDGGYWITRPIN
jgi:hypothetical protein